MKNQCFRTILSLAEYVPTHVNEKGSTNGRPFKFVVSFKLCLFDFPLLIGWDIDDLR